MLSESKSGQVAGMEMVDSVVIQDYLWDCSIFLLPVFCF